jgi:hypothetical protein
MSQKKASAKKSANSPYMINTFLVDTTKNTNPIKNSSAKGKKK